jgi:hypothetical protein
MIDTELENSDRSVILKRQTFNAQPAFGKPAVRRGAQGSIIEIGDGELPGRSSQQKLSGLKRSVSVETTERRFRSPRWYQRRMEPTTGFEPVTCGLRNRCSTS